MVTAFVESTGPILNAATTLQMLLDFRVMLPALEFTIPACPNRSVLRSRDHGKTTSKQQIEADP